MPGEIDRLVADAFHQAAVAADHVGMMVDQLGTVARRERALGDRHADRHREALPQWSRRRLDAEQVAIFGMTGSAEAELAEALDLLDVHVRVAGQVHAGVKQHRAVAGRQHEAVAVGPARVGGVEFQHLGEQHRRHVRHAHRHARVAGIGFFNRVHSEEADRVGHHVGGNGGTCGHFVGASASVPPRSRAAREEL